jgi:hypothetical protein
MEKNSSLHNSSGKFNYVRSCNDAIQLEFYSVGLALRIYIDKENIAHEIQTSVTNLCPACIGL